MPSCREETVDVVVQGRVASHDGGGTPVAICRAHSCETRGAKCPSIFRRYRCSTSMVLMSGMGRRPLVNFGGLSQEKLYRTLSGKWYLELRSKSEGFPGIGLAWRLIEEHEAQFWL